MPISLSNLFPSIPTLPPYSQNTFYSLYSYITTLSKTSYAHTTLSYFLFSLYSNSLIVYNSLPPFESPHLSIQITLILGIIISLPNPKSTHIRPILLHISNSIFYLSSTLYTLNILYSISYTLNISTLNS